MRIIFFCIETDTLTIGQILKACKLINENLRISYEKIELVFKPVKRKPRALVNRPGGLIDRLYKLFNLNVFNSISTRVKLHRIRKEIGNNNIVKIHNISSANSERALQILDVDKEKLVFFVYYDEIIGESVLRLCDPLNVHPGFLPEFRGISPLHWQIKEQKKIAAITIHRMTSGIDEGNIIAEVPFSIENKKTSFEVEMENYSNNVIANALYVAVRRLIKFDNGFGIPQNSFKDRAKYYGRP